MDIKKRRNIIAYEMTVKIASTETHSQKTIESLKKNVEDCKDDLSTVYMAAQPMFNDINHLHYEAEAAGKLNEVIQDKYTPSLKDGSTGRGVQELQDITNLSNSKAKESEQGMLNEEEENQTGKNSKKNLLRRH